MKSLKFAPRYRAMVTTSTIPYRTTLPGYVVNTPEDGTQHARPTRPMEATARSRSPVASAVTVGTIGPHRFQHWHHVSEPHRCRPDGNDTDRLPFSASVFVIVRLGRQPIPQRAVHRAGEFGDVGNSRSGQIVHAGRVDDWGTPTSLVSARRLPSLTAADDEGFDEFSCHRAFPQACFERIPRAFGDPAGSGCPLVSCTVSEATVVLPANL